MRKVICNFSEGEATEGRIRQKIHMGDKRGQNGTPGSLPKSPLGFREETGLI